MRGNGYSGSREGWKRGGHMGGRLKMDNIKFLGKQRRQSMVNELAVKAEERSSFQHLRTVDNENAAWHERRGDANV